MPRSRVDDLQDWCEIIFLLEKDFSIYSVTRTFFLIPLAAEAAACLIYDNTNLQVTLESSAAVLEHKDVFLLCFPCTNLSRTSITCNYVVAAGLF